MNLYSKVGLGNRRAVGRSILLSAGLAMAASAASAQTFTSSDTPLPVPIVGSSGTTTSTISVTAGGVISDLNVGLNLNHTWAGDLDITVASPSGTMVVLVDRPGVPPGSFGNFNDYTGLYTFDDAAAGPIPESDPLPPGSYQPGTGEQLSDFNGEAASGVWTITINDNAASDTGTLNFWQLLFMLNSPEQEFVAPVMADALSHMTRNRLGSLNDRKTAAFAAPSNSISTTSGYQGVATNNPYLGGGGGFWMRGGGAHSEFEAAITGLATPGGADYDGDSGFIEAGYSGLLNETESGRFIWSAFAHYQQGDFDVSNNAGVFQGDFDTDGFGIGAGVTWLGVDGRYADLSVQYAWNDVDVTTSAGDTASTDAETFAASLEVGMSVELENDWAVLPQAQLSLIHTDIDGYTDTAGTVVSFGSSTRAEARVGLGLEKTGELTSMDGRYRANITASLTRDFGSDDAVVVNGTTLNYDDDSSDGLLSAGFSINPNSNGLKFGLQGNYRHSIDGNDDRSYSGSATIGIKF